MRPTLENTVLIQATPAASRPAVAATPPARSGLRKARVRQLLSQIERLKVQQRNGATMVPAQLRKLAREAYLRECLGADRRLSPPTWDHDWLCPNRLCDMFNFGDRWRCARCRATRPPLLAPGVLQLWHRCFWKRWMWAVRVIQRHFRRWLRTRRLRTAGVAGATAPARSRRRQGQGSACHQPADSAGRRGPPGAGHRGVHGPELPAALCDGPRGTARRAGRGHGPHDPPQDGPCGGAHRADQELPNQVGPCGAARRDDQGPEPPHPPRVEAPGPTQPICPYRIWSGPACEDPYWADIGAPWSEAEAGRAVNMAGGLADGVDAPVPSDGEDEL
mmetsp:Transcript_100668/g.285271  ORF Transcript_100668/g.285271 Transcript_100668/m.285271 type:complete len:333 (+) Transcript_100668:544-1542(+)